MSKKILYIQFCEFDHLEPDCLIKFIILIPKFHYLVYFQRYKMMLEGYV